jgi:hypothetical protein
MLLWLSRRSRRAILFHLFDLIGSRKRADVELAVRDAPVDLELRDGTAINKLEKESAARLAFSWRIDKGFDRICNVW